VAGTALADGEYRNLNNQYLSSPPVDVATGLMPLVTYRRWLTVEDALYDQAAMYFDDTLVYRNVGTPSGFEHTLDRRWVQHDLPLDDFAGSGPITLTWTLTSDPGLEYGGWTLDDVCVVELADVPGHYRAAVDASDDRDDGVLVQWENPWIVPLADVVLVRNRDRIPGDRMDGEWLYIDQDAVPGHAFELLDAALLPGEEAWYAVFASDGERWFEAAIDGKNADRGAVRSGSEDSGDTDTDTDTDTDLDTDDELDLEPAGCGCVAGGATSMWWLGALALVAVRRLR
jgi:hypothetical protein